MLRKTRAVFPSLAVIIAVITIMALKSNHLKDPAVSVSPGQKIWLDAGHYFSGIYGRQFSRGFIIGAHTDKLLCACKG